MKPFYRAAVGRRSIKSDGRKGVTGLVLMPQAGRTPLDCAKDWNLLQKIFMHVSARWEEAKVAQRKAESELGAEREKRELAEARVRELEGSVEHLLLRKLQMRHSLSLPPESVGPVLED